MSGSGPGGTIPVMFTHVIAREFMADRMRAIEDQANVNGLRATARGSSDGAEVSARKRTRPSRWFARR